MFEDFLWDKFYEMDNEAQKQEARAWQWMRFTYSATLDMHTPNKIFGLSTVSFFEGERKPINLFSNPKANDAMAKIYLKRRVLNVCADAASAKSLNLLMDRGYELKWINATLTRNADKQVAWMLGINNAIVYAKLADGIGGTKWFGLVCGDITEMMPKNLVPVPDALQT